MKKYLKSEISKVKTELFNENVNFQKFGTITHYKL